MTLDPEPDFPSGPASHLYLIETARELPAIANKGDHAHLSLVASSLLEAFVRHAEEERHLVLRLPPITARLVENGQQRGVGPLVSLGRGARHGGVTWRCVSMGHQIACQKAHTK